MATHPVEAKEDEGEGGEHHARAGVVDHLQLLLDAAFDGLEGQDERDDGRRHNGQGQREPEDPPA